MITIVLAAGGGTAAILDTVERLASVLGSPAVTEAGTNEPGAAEQDWLVVADEDDREIHELLPALYGTRVIPSPAGSSLLERWLVGTAATSADLVWLIDTTLPPPASALSRLRHGLGMGDGVFGAGHVLLPRQVVQERSAAWRALDPRNSGGLDRLWDVMKEVGLRPLPIEDVPSIVPLLGMDATVHAPDPSSVIIGRHTIARESAVIRAFHYTEISIGAFCSISWEVLISNHGGTGTRLRDAEGRPVPARLTRFAGGHHAETATTFPLSESISPDPGVVPVDLERSQFSRPLVIGSDVWIGVGAKVLGGVTIGHGAVVSAGAVVLSDVPPYAVVMGNPAKVVRYRFSQPVIAQLLAIRWWEWPDEVIAARSEWFTRPISEFVSEFGPMESTTAAG
jgi:acetyltransferase-like isoleucine patch superfamily enzyme